MNTHNHSRRVARTLAGVVLAASVLLAPAPRPASADAFPGVNGRLIFSDVNGFDLKSVRTDGSDRQTISSGPGDQTDAEYSPDGTRIVYRQIVSGVDQVFVAKADGSSPQQLTTGTDFSFTPSWSPDGARIVYIHQVSGVQKIYRMNVDGSNQTQLTSTASYFDPQYSPDGTKLVALLDASDDEVVVMNADGTGIVNLTNNSVDEQKASWSPSGAKIVYSSNVGGGLPELFTMNPDGSGKTQITSDGVGYRYPVYSPDGTKLAFIDSAAPSPIYIANADGSNITAVANSSWAREVSWQPLTHRPASSNPNPTVTLINGKVSIAIAAMYTDSYEGIDNATVAITSSPSAGVASIDATTGVINYSVKAAAAHPSVWNRLAAALSPAANAGGAVTDSFTYRVCSRTSSSLCSTGVVTINLFGAPGTGAGRPDDQEPLAWLLATLSVLGIWLGLRRLYARSRFAHRA